MAFNLLAIAACGGRVSGGTSAASGVISVSGSPLTSGSDVTGSGGAASGDVSTGATSGSSSGTSLVTSGVSTGAVTAGAATGDSASGATGGVTTGASGDGTSGASGATGGVTTGASESGSCAGTTCPAGWTCQGGTCCMAGWTACSIPAVPGLFCFDEQNDSNNCGGCGQVCPTWQQCQGGTCVCPNGGIACESTSAQADDGGYRSCVNAQTDPNNCGSCGRQCSIAETCLGGSCSSALPTADSVKAMCPLYGTRSFRPPDFCVLFNATCTGANEILPGLATVSACEMTYSGWTVSQQDCRSEHLCNATETGATLIHCPHAQGYNAGGTPTPGGPCP